MARSGGGAAGEHGVWVVGAFVVGAVVSDAYGLASSALTNGMDAGRVTDPPVAAEL
jgi:hypothetical protein